MITGFNTDVEHNGVTYHVQTEDKGLETPFILTLVYDRGTILARKRQPYEDLFETGFDEKALEERLHRQHRLICAAINVGRIHDLIALTRREAQKTDQELSAAATTEADEFAAKDDDSAPIPKPQIDVAIVESKEIYDSEPVIDVLSIIEEEFLLPEEAVEIVSDMAGRERSSHNRLCVEFINETAFKSGERTTVTFMVCRGSERKVVRNAQILVKILGSNFRPQIFHSITDQNGLAKMDVELPDFSSGRGALLVRASSAGEEIELRRSIMHS